MELLYNIGIRLFAFAALIISPFSGKTKQWIKGNKGWYDSLKEKVLPGEKYTWIHCASLGEFEQGRPLIEAIRSRNPDEKILLTFFSPSGYEVRKNYQQADIICYLPPDTPGNAKLFTGLVNPAKVIFIKYEFWHNYIKVLNDRDIPVYLVSGIFRKDQHFFRWYGGFFRKILKRFRWFYLQDEASAALLQGIGLENVTVAGDTRFDRVVQIASAAKDIPVLEQFRGNEKLFLAGSSWGPDEEIIAAYINKYPDRMKWVFAPHEITPSNISRLESLLRVSTVRFSKYTAGDASARVLIIDNIGMLSSAYRYAGISAVGGGFGKGIHNVLEPACWGIPVLFGPNHNKFREAVGLKESGGAFSFNDYKSFEAALNALLDDDDFREKCAATAGTFVSENAGATELVLSGIY